jgi:Tol biopolymer transport system component
LIAVAAFASLAVVPNAFSDKPASSVESKYLRNIRQVTSGFVKAGEGYFSPDGKTAIYQAQPKDYPFYQIYTQPLAGGEATRVSTGRGRTTCSYFSPDGKRILFASSHLDPDLNATEAAAIKQQEEDRRSGRRPRYQWDFDPHMDIYVCDFDGTNLRRLTDADGYDAEGSYSHDGKRIVFTSTRDGDPDLFLMDADGSNVRQLTNVDGYDGGPFFSPDDKWVIFRSDREKEHMLQVYAISADGKTEVQLTDDLNTVNWAPYFHPSGKYIVWARADYSRGPQSANFDLYTMEIEAEGETLKGGKTTRITFDEKADVLPVFSPDGTKLMWTSTRTLDESSQLWIGDWLRGRKQK